MPSLLIRGAGIWAATSLSTGPGATDGVAERARGEDAGRRTSDFVAARARDVDVALDARAVGAFLAGGFAVDAGDFRFDDGADAFVADAFAAGGFLADALVAAEVERDADRFDDAVAAALVDVVATAFFAGAFLAAGMVSAPRDGM